MSEPGRQIRVRLRVTDFAGALYADAVWPLPAAQGFYSVRPNNIRCACGRVQWLDFQADVHEAGEENAGDGQESRH